MSKLFSGGSSGGIKPSKFVSTGFSTLNRSKNSRRASFLKLDPSIRGIQEEVLGGIRSRLIPQSQEIGPSGISSEVIQGFRDLLPRVRDLPVDVADAAIRPFRDNLERSLAQTQRGFARRGFGGSSLAESVLGEQRRLGERDIADIRSQIDFDTQAGALGLEAQLLQGLQGADSEELRQRQLGLIAEQDTLAFLEQIANDRLNQELSLLGIGDTKAGDPARPANQGTKNIVSAAARIGASLFGGGLF